MSGTTQSVHGQWSNRFAFFLAATGAAVGLGNIWKFPYIMGEHGGGAFMLVYLLCIFLIGAPVLIAEVMIGRRGRQSPGLSAKALAIESNASSHWQILGWMGLVAGFLILTFYAVIAGWGLAYVFKAGSGSFTGASAEQISDMFGSFVSDPLTLIFWSAFIIVSTCIVVGRGVKKGLDVAVRYSMPGLFLLIIILAVYAATTGALAEALEFMFKPDFSRLTFTGVLVALGHAFFSLSLASGAMIIYGAYLPKNVSIVQSSIWIVITDTIVGLVAGIAIYPIVFGYGLEPDSGPNLMFIALPLAFGSMPFGALFGVLFFVMVVFAAFTSTIAMIESTVAWLVESKGFKRWQAATLSGFLIWLLSLLTVFSFTGASWAQHQINFLGKDVNNFFEMVDHLTSGILLPVGGLITAVFVGWVMKVQASKDELACRPLTYTIWYLSLRWFAPVAITSIFLHLLGVFEMLQRVFSI